MIANCELPTPYLLNVDVLERYLKNERYLTMAADLEKIFSLGDNLLLSVKECADLLDVSEQTMRKIAENNGLRIVTLNASKGRGVPQKILSSDLKRYVTALLDGGK